jgi:prepilin-type N-terminal cleavage/methylation domain-containing protein
VKTQSRVSTSTSDDSGFTLIEVLIALMVFAIIATSVAYSLTLSMVMTRDSRSREVAANLAAQQIDVARSLQNVFSVTSGTTTQVVDGTTYTITQTANWVTSTGSSGTCGSSSGLLQNKSVTISVKWSGMKASTPAITANTFLAPSGPLNDQASGTILVHVTGASSAGIANIPVSAKPDASVPGNTATTVVPAPANTDTDGCSYVLKVVPGSYLIQIGAAGDGKLDQNQVNAPSRTYPVTAGSSAAAEFQYDTANRLAVTYASNSALSNILYPSNLMATFVSSAGAYTTSVGTITTKVATTPLFPFPSGYALFAGTYIATGSTPTCLSVDPQAWTTPNASGKVGVRQQPVTANGKVPMGVVTVTPGNNMYVTAISKTPPTGSGDPGCSTPMIYTFTTKSSGGSQNLALPYGSWTLYANTSVTTTPAATTAIAASAVTLPTGSTIKSGNVFTLDPR